MPWCGVVWCVVRVVVGTPVRSSQARALTGTDIAQSILVAQPHNANVMSHCIKADKVSERNREDQRKIITLLYSFNPAGSLEIPKYCNAYNVVYRNTN